jgi:hypothetical protein
MATSYLSPGVYVEEVDRGPKPIESVGTSTAGFLGTCTKGPVNKPIFIGNWTQFVNTFGDFRDSQFLAHSVYGFFNNGGTRCFVTNVGAHPGGLDRADAQAAAPAPAGKDDKKGDKKGAAASGGGDVTKILNGMFIGEDKGPNARTGLKSFEDIDDLSLVLAPGQTSPAIPTWAASTRSPSPATRSTAPTTSPGSRSTTPSAGTSSCPRPATWSASTRASTASAASTRRLRTRSSAARWA